MARHHVIVDGIKIAEARALKRPFWTLEKLAENADISVRKLQQLEGGGSHPVKTVFKVAEALSLKLEDLTSSETIIGVQDISHGMAIERGCLIGMQHLGQALDKQILARDPQAQQLLGALQLSTTRMVSITAPAGFGKSALMLRAIQILLGPHLDPSKAGLTGIAILNANKLDKPLECADFADVLNRLLGTTNTLGATEDIFFDSLSRAGKIWIVVENAEVIVRGGVSPELRSFLVSWCGALHEAKLIFLTRDEFPFFSESNIPLPEVEVALLDGLPQSAAVALLKRSLKGTRFKTAQIPLLQEVVIQLHRMPVVIEAFAGYLRAREFDIVDFDEDFVAANDLLRLFHPSQEGIQRFFFHIIQQQLGTISPAARSLLRFVVEFANCPIPHAALLAIEKELGLVEDDSLTKLVRSHLLVKVKTATEGQSFTTHSLIRMGALEAFESLGIKHLRYEPIVRALHRACEQCAKQGDGRLAESLWEVTFACAWGALLTAVLSRDRGHQPTEIAGIVGDGDAKEMYHRICRRYLDERLFDQEFHPHEGTFSNAALRRRVSACYEDLKVDAKSVEFEEFLAQMLYDDQFTERERQEVLLHFETARLRQRS